MGEVCRICPKNCAVDREKHAGFCGVGSTSYVARCALHMWEEPFISGKNGSGTIFFCGCNLRCIFCQNHEISTCSAPDFAVPADAHRLCEMMLKLQGLGAHNINFVSPTPHVHLIADAVVLARKSGLTVPTVFNTNSYIETESLKRLDGLIDIYLADMKYATDALAKMLSGAEDYPQKARAAIKEMYAQCGNMQLDADGMAVRGLVIRHLVLPGNVGETAKVLDIIAEDYPKDIYISLMSQYFPTHKANTLPPLDRPLLGREYARATNYALAIGFSNVLVQKMQSATSEYVPKWGVL